MIRRLGDATAKRSPTLGEQHAPERQRVLCGMADGGVVEHAPHFATLSQVRPDPGAHFLEEAPVIRGVIHAWCAVQAEVDARQVSKRL